MSTIIKEIQIQNPSGQYTAAPIGANAENIFLSNNRTLDQVVEDFGGADAITAGSQGLVPAPAIGDQNKVLKGDGTWGTIPSAVESINGKTGVVTLTADDVEAIPDTKIGVANGVAELDSSGKIVSSQIPGVIGKIYEAETKDSFPASGEVNAIYIALDTNKVYRWGGTVYVEISEGVVIGTTSDSAARGDWGQIAYAHAQAKGAAYTAGLYKFATNAEGHVIAAETISESDLGTYNIQKQMQYNIMPEPSADLVNTVIQYTGTDGTYKSGTFYKCILSDGNYIWEVINSGGSSTTILSQSLAASATTVTFTDDLIGTDVLIEAFASVPGFNYLTMEQTSSTSITIRYPEHTTAVTIYLALTSI